MADPRVLVAGAVLRRRHLLTTTVPGLRVATEGAPVGASDAGRVAAGRIGDPASAPGTWSADGATAGSFDPRQGVVGGSAPADLTGAGAVGALAAAANTGVDVGTFLSEVGWREFAWHTLFHNTGVDGDGAAEPGLHVRGINPQFDGFPWRRPEPHELAAWQRGETGFGVVDAGMRELWQSGFMHNRVRMVTASFLTKNLLTDWRVGEAWFWDTLVDADAASNPFNWQWVAGCGADAAPYFRVFNPETQRKKFDPDGAYVRRWVPELAHLPGKSVHQPWRAADGYAEGYPHPVVEHDEERKEALARYEQVRRGRSPMGAVPGARRRRRLERFTARPAPGAGSSASTRPRGRSACAPACPASPATRPPPPRP